jgi:microcystin degradation protein MlrC
MAAIQSPIVFHHNFNIVLKKGVQKMSFKVLTAEVFHETNTFSNHQTDEASFRNRFFLSGQTALKERANANTELAGFVDASLAYDWYMTHVLSVNAGPSGRVTQAAFNWFCDPIVERASEGFLNGELDGILLALHGAMVPDFCEDGEGELLRRIRQVVDRSIPIAITLDLHANVTDEMIELADIIISYKTYPHIDMRQIARQAGDILQQTMAGTISPRTIMARAPMLEEVNGGRTDTGPMLARIEKALTYEMEEDVFAVSINGGFASADISEVGPTVLVTGQGDFDAHRRFAKSLADDIWDKRHIVLNRYYSVEEAAHHATSFESKNGPLIIADYADNPGAGAYGDSTALLKALLEVNVGNACFGPIVDPAVVEQLQLCKIGSSVQIELGGKTDPTFGGGPLAVKATLLLLCNGNFVGDGPMMAGLKDSFGPSAVIRVGGIDILITTLARQMLDLQQFKTFGIEPEQKKIVAIKSMQHFRAAFEPIAGQVIVCDSGALCTPQYNRLPYQNVARPIFPLDVDS